MYILTGKYFPTDSWPDLYFPALLEASLVDIQYTEVVEFTLAIATSAEFDVVLPNDETILVGGVVTTGGGAQFGILPNGTYSEYGTHDGKTRYRMASSGFTVDGYLYIVWVTSESKWYFSVYGTDAHSDVIIKNSNMFTSSSNVATPDLAVWNVGNYGTTIPTVTETVPQLYELIAFTLEMPMVLEIELYEELSK